MLKKTIGILVILLALGACQKKFVAPLTAEVNLITEEEGKTMEVISVGYGKDRNSAIYDAEKKVFEVLFFRGIPNSNQEDPMIGINESELINKHSAYFKTFFGTRYKTFIMSEFDNNSGGKNKGYVKSVLQVKINIHSLKMDLENAGLKRGFGF